MPIYEYACNECDHRFEVIQKMSDSPLEACLLCDGAVRKLLSLSSFHLKGTGWYKTDYASPSPKSEKPDKPTEGKSNVDDSK